jgi:hypothetical protein
MPAEQGSPALRFVVTAKPGTVQVGRPSQIDVEMYAPNGAKVPAKADTLVTLTITTLPTLDAARKEGGAAAASAAKPVSLEKQQFTLPAGSSVRRITGIFPRGEGDVEFTVTSASAGRLRVFAEASGVESGSTLIAVSDRVYVMPKAARPPVGDVQRVSLVSQEPTRVKLVFLDSGRDVVRRAGQLTQGFQVSLETDDGAFAAPDSDLQVDLRVHKGRARFEPQSLTIPANQSLSAEADLLSSLGGQVEIRARSRVPEIAEARREYTFEPGLRTTDLEITAGSPSALANGLDEIPIDVQAVFRRPNQQNVVVRAEQEELEGRVVSFRVKSGSARFVGGTNQITIPKNESSGRVVIVGTSPSRSVVIEARSSNGLEENVTGETTVAFYLPWWQLLFAAIGGLLLPAINRKPPASIALGSLGGVILYLFIFFGAVATGIFNVGPWAVAVTKLPSENVLAAAVLGVIGYMSTRRAFDPNKGRAKPKPA